MCIYVVCVSGKEMRKQAAHVEKDHLRSLGKELSLQILGLQLQVGCLKQSRKTSYHLHLARELYGAVGMGVLQAEVEDAHRLSLYQDHSSLSLSCPCNCPFSLQAPPSSLSPEVTSLVASRLTHADCVCVCVLGVPPCCQAAGQKSAPFCSSRLSLRLEGSGCVSWVFGRPGLACKTYHRPVLKRVCFPVSDSLNSAFHDAPLAI